MSARTFALAALLATSTAGTLDGAETLPRQWIAAVETGTTYPGVRAEVRCDGERTSFSASFPDPDSELRAAGVGFLVGYILVIEVVPPDAPAETFASPLLAPAVGLPEAGHVTVGHVEPRAWPAGTRFFLAVHDRDGNLL